MAHKILFQGTFLVIITAAAVYGRPSVSRKNDGNGNFGFKYEVAHYPGISRGHFNSGKASSEVPHNIKPIVQNPHNNAYTPHQGSSSEHLPNYHGNPEEKHATYKREQQPETIYEPRSIYPSPYDSAAKNAHGDSLEHNVDYTSPSHGVSVPESGDLDYNPNHSGGISYSGEDYDPRTEAYHQPNIPQEHITVNAPHDQFLPSKPQEYVHSPISQEHVDKPILQEPIPQEHVNPTGYTDHVSPIYQQNNHHTPQQYSNLAHPVEYIQAPHTQGYINAPFSQDPIEKPITRDHISPSISQEHIDPPVIQDHISPPFSQDHIETPISQGSIELSLPHSHAEPSAHRGVKLPISQDHIDPPISQELVVPTVPESLIHTPLPASPSGIKTISKEPKYQFVPSGPPLVTNAFTTQIIHPPLQSDPPHQSLELSHSQAALPAVENVNYPPVSHAFRLGIPSSPVAAIPSEYSSAVEPAVYNDNHHAAPVSHATRLSIPSATISKEPSLGKVLSEQDLHPRPQEAPHSSIEPIDSDLDGLEFPELDGFPSFPESPELSHQGHGAASPPISHAFKLLLPGRNPSGLELNSANGGLNPEHVSHSDSSLPRVSHAFRLNVAPSLVPEVEHFDGLSSSVSHFPSNTDDSGLLAVETKFGE